MRGGGRGATLGKKGLYVLLRRNWDQRQPRAWLLEIIISFSRSLLEFGRHVEGGESWCNRRIP